MNTEPLSKPSQTESPAPSLPFPASAVGRLVYGLYVIAMPILAFWGMTIFQPEWQSGRASDYLALWMTPPAQWLFLILLAYSILCYLFLLNNPARYSGSPAIRLGIYTGVLLALQYSIATFISAPDLSNSYGTVIVLVVTPLLAWKGYVWATRQWGYFTVTLVALFLLAVVYVIISVAAASAGSPLLLTIFGVVIVSPFWSFLLSGRAALWLLYEHEHKLTFPRLFGITAWLGAYTLAWRISILKMYELYAALPTSPPDCYIATAAAQGHPRIVRSKQIVLADGRSMRVNRQLQRLKCGELALMAVAPRLHAILRKMYDVLGSRLARTLKNPYLADLAYLLLWPWERLVLFCLKFLVPNIESITSAIYTN